MKDPCDFARSFVVAAVVEDGVVKLVWAKRRASTGVDVATWKNG
jgi:hypothetical protein